MGRATCTIDSVSAPNQPGRKLIYCDMKEAMSLLSKCIYLQCKKCKWAPITAFQCLRLNEVPFSQSINYRFISNSTVYKRTYAVSSVWKIALVISKILQIQGLQPRILDIFSITEINLFSQKGRTILETKYHYHEQRLFENVFNFPKHKIVILADVLRDKTDLRPLDLRYEKVVFIWYVFL